VMVILLVEILNSLQSHVPIPHSAIFAPCTSNPVFGNKDVSENA